MYCSGKHEQKDSGCDIVMWCDVIDCDEKIGCKWIFKFAREGAELWPYLSRNQTLTCGEGSGSETSYIPVLFMCIVCSSGHYLCPIISMEHKGVWCPLRGVLGVLLLCGCASRNTNDTGLVPMPNSLWMRLQCHLMTFSCYTMCSLESWWLTDRYSCTIM